METNLKLHTRDHRKTYKNIIRKGGDKTGINSTVKRSRATTTGFGDTGGFDATRIDSGFVQQTVGNDTVSEEHTNRSYSNFENLNSIEKRKSLSRKRSLISKKSSLNISPGMRSQLSFNSDLNSGTAKRMSMKAMKLQRLAIQKTEQQEPVKNFETI